MEVIFSCTCLAVVSNKTFENDVIILEYFEIKFHSFPALTQNILKLFDMLHIKPLLN